MGEGSWRAGGLTSESADLKPLGYVTFPGDRGVHNSPQKLHVPQADEIIYHILNDTLKTHGLSSDLGKAQRCISTLLSFKSLTFQKSEVASVLCDVRISLLGCVHSGRAPLSWESTDLVSLDKLGKKPRLSRGHWTC